MPKKVVIEGWVSDDLDPESMGLSDLAREMESGAGICTLQKQTGQTNDPAALEAEGALHFFAGTLDK